MSDRQERIWRCDCGDNHFLSVIRYPDDPEGYLSLVDGTNCRSLWHRIKAAWSILRGGCGFGHWGIEIKLNPEKARELIGELEAQWRAPTGRRTYDQLTEQEGGPPNERPQ